MRATVNGMRLPQNWQDYGAIHSGAKPIVKVASTPTTVWNGNPFCDPGCVLYLPGFPGSGATTYDFSGQGNHGTVFGATWTRLGSGLWYLDFDGIDNEVTHPTFLDVMPTALTIICWTKLDTGGAGGLNPFICGKQNIAARDRIFFGTNVNALNLRLFLEAENVTNEVSTVAVMVLGTWHFTAGVYEAGVQQRVILDTEDKASVLAPGTIQDGTLTDFCIGAHYTGSAAVYHVNGGIPVFRIINAALTPAQLQGIRSQERHLFGV